MAPLFLRSLFFITSRSRPGCWVGIPKSVRSRETGWDALVAYVLFSDGSSSANSFVTLAAGACVSVGTKVSYRSKCWRHQRVAEVGQQKECTVNAAGESLAN